jgi:hypothetical protein
VGVDVEGCQRHQAGVTVTGVPCTWRHGPRLTSFNQPSLIHPPSNTPYTTVICTHQLVWSSSPCWVPVVATGSGSVPASRDMEGLQVEWNLSSFDAHI